MMCERPWRTAAHSTLQSIVHIAANGAPQVKSPLRPSPTPVAQQFKPDRRPPFRVRPRLPSLPGPQWPPSPISWIQLGTANNCVIRSLARSLQLQEKQKAEQKQNESERRGEHIANDFPSTERRLTSIQSPAMASPEVDRVPVLPSGAVSPVAGPSGIHLRPRRKSDNGGGGGGGSAVSGRRGQLQAAGGKGGRGQQQQQQQQLMQQPRSGGSGGGGGKKVTFGGEMVRPAAVNMGLRYAGGRRRGNNAAAATHVMAKSLSGDEAKKVKTAYNLERESVQTFSSTCTAVQDITYGVFAASLLLWHPLPLRNP